MNKLNFYSEISKTDDEQRLVYGYASTEALDSHGEIISKDAIGGALDDYMKFANIREMHKASAVGVTEQAQLDEKGLYIVAKVVDDAAWAKVKAGVYKGFSIGGKLVEKVGDTITKMKLTEISLVDRPACPEAMIEVFKLEDEHETQVEEVQVEKSLCTTARIANLLNELNWLKEDNSWEAEYKENETEVPTKLKEAIKALAEALTISAQEEAAEVAEGDEPVEEAPVDKMDQLLDLVKSMVKTEVKPEEVIEKVDSDETIAKLADMEASLKKISDENETLKKRVKELEDKPAAPKGVARVVEKSDDVGTSAEAKGQDVSKMTPKEIIKAIQSGRF